MEQAHQASLQRLELEARTLKDGEIAASTRISELESKTKELEGELGAATASVIVSQDKVKQLEDKVLELGGSLQTEGNSVGPNAVSLSPFLEHLVRPRLTLRCQEQGLFRLNRHIVAASARASESEDAPPPPLAGSKRGHDAASLDSPGEIRDDADESMRDDADESIRDVAPQRPPPIMEQPSGKKARLTRDFFRTQAASAQSPSSLQAGQQTAAQTQTQAQTQHQAQPQTQTHTQTRTPAQTGAEPAVTSSSGTGLASESQVSHLPVSQPEQISFRSPAQPVSPPFRTGLQIYQQQQANQLQHQQQPQTAQSPQLPTTRRNNLPLRPHEQQTPQPQHSRIGIQSSLPRSAGQSNFHQSASLGHPSQGHHSQPSTFHPLLAGRSDLTQPHAQSSPSYGSRTSPAGYGPRSPPSGYASLGHAASPSFGSSRAHASQRDYEAFLASRSTVSAANAHPGTHHQDSSPTQPGHGRQPSDAEMDDQGDIFNMPDPVADWLGVPPLRVNDPGRRGIVAEPKAIGPWTDADIQAVAQPRRHCGFWECWQNGTCLTMSTRSMLNSL